MAEGTAFSRNDTGNARKIVYFTKTSGIRSSKLAITEKIVTTHNFYFLSAIGIFLGVLLSIAGYYYSQSRQSTQESWEELLKKDHLDRPQYHRPGRPRPGGRIWAAQANR